MNNTKNLGGKNKIREVENKLEVVQDQLVYYYDIDDIKENIDLLNAMIANNNVKILSVYLNKEKEEGEGNEKNIFILIKIKKMKNLKNWN